ncbi:hypothetical protein [Priestia aryabhattai]|uniref:hypothetical protein n=1 Tax=Priestia aryabhattai TaxID=412384 RepID=UPI001C8D43BE|nr:hypothetical protein [Priestia aryabhattai]MBX9997316.1 hypothetical protein [Priestia aryabhattai]
MKSHKISKYKNNCRELKENRKGNTLLEMPYFKEVLLLLCASSILLLLGYSIGVVNFMHFKVFYIVIKPMLFPLSLMFLIIGIMHLKRHYWWYAGTSIAVSLIFLYLS